MTALDPLKLYRLPWSLTDNPIAWLEPTQQCNLACDGCYRENLRQHKSLEEIAGELATFAKLRNFDGVSIAGGDPLLHPDIVQIVERVHAMGRKPILNTNGLALTRELLVKLKTAGLVGLTFHVDCHQGRPGWRDKTEKQMNELRQQYVDLVSSVGDVAIAFNSTVYDDTLDQVPDVVAWAGRNIDRVHTVVFIVYRAAHKEGFDYFANGHKIDVSRLVYSIDQPRRTDITARDVVAKIREDSPEFEPCAYLGGTVDPNSFKWLIGMRIGSRSKVHGWVGPRFMEMSQTGHHFLTKRYMAYAPPAMLSAGRGTMMSAWPVDSGVRAASKSWLRAVARDPRHALEKQHFQAVVCIQPIDVMPDGRDNMCDGCPDMTVHEGKLVWSCRLEEWRQFGTTMTAAPRGCGASPTTRNDGLISIRTPSSAAE